MNEEKTSLTIPSIFGNEEILVETVGSVARIKGYPFEKVNKLKSAVAELSVNAIEHGNRNDPDKNVVMTISCEESAMRVSIRDYGDGRLDPDFSKPDIGKQVADKKLGGWGMYLVHTLVDEMNIDAVPDEGTTTTVIIRN
jgi:anti-sigma regulatory factor (Ser/Thr protein kinase)